MFNKTLNEFFRTKCLAINRREIVTIRIKKRRVEMLYLSLKREEKQVKHAGVGPVELTNQNASTIWDIYFYREMSTKDGTRPSRKLPNPALMGQRPGTAAAALQKRKLRPLQDWRKERCVRRHIKESAAIRVWVCTRCSVSTITHRGVIGYLRLTAEWGSFFNLWTWLLQCQISARRDTVNIPVCVCGVIVNKCVLKYSSADSSN